MKTLLLNSSYDLISFIEFRKLIKLVVKDKVEIISSWDIMINWTSGSMKHPSVIRMKRYVPSNKQTLRFKRKAVFRRDMFICQYCYRKFSPGKLTIDHIVPKSKGGKGTWENCVTCCDNCNSEKANKLLEESGFKLLKNPVPPSKPIINEYVLMDDKYDGWDIYFEAYLGNR